MEPGPVPSNKNAKVEHAIMKHASHRAPESAPAQVTLAGFAGRVGALRVMLAVVVLLCLPMAFVTSTDPVGWQTVPSYVVPGLVVCIAWGLPFDILMSRVFLVGSNAPDYRHRHRSIVVLDLGLLTALLVFWGPFFLSILKR